MSDITHKIDQTINYAPSDLTNQIQEFNLDVTANHIYLFGEAGYAHHEADGQEPGVEFVMANRFIKNLNILMRHSDSPILIHMKTCGGYWAEGMAIYDAIKACPNKITILNYTHARSMSSIIFQAADKRVMMPSSEFMIHDGTFGFDGTVKQAYNEVNQLKKTEAIMFGIYIEKMKEKGKFSKKSKKFIHAWIRDQMDKKEEVYFDSKEAVTYGFADEIFGGDGIYDWKSLLKYEDD